MRRADWVIEEKSTFAMVANAWHRPRALNRRKVRADSEEWTAGRPLNEHRVSAYGIVHGHMSAGDALSRLQEHFRTVTVGFLNQHSIYRVRNRRTDQLIMVGRHMG